MLNMLSQTESASGSITVFEIIKLVVPGILSFVGVLLGLWVWHYKKKNEPKYNTHACLCQGELDSLMQAWSLLAYITLVENPKAVIVWERNSDDTTYYLRNEQGEAFIGELSEVFYAGGYGLFLSEDIKRLFYEYRNLVYGVLLSSKGKMKEDNKVEIRNSKLIDSVKRIYEELNFQLRKEKKKMEESV